VSQAIGGHAWQSSAPSLPCLGPSDSKATCRAIFRNLRPNSNGGQHSGESWCFQFDKWAIEERAAEETEVPLSWTAQRIRLMRYRVPVATQQKSRPARKSGARGEDRRTTLRVPAALEAELSRTARSLGVSENEALVYLAQLGAETADRHRTRQRVIARHRKAISRLNGSTAGTFPSPQEAREAILADRG
jgi:hypothetical protein